MGRDTKKELLAIAADPVSIHAPAWGATASTFFSSIIDSSSPLLLISIFSFLILSLLSFFCFLYLLSNR